VSLMHLVNNCTTFLEIAECLDGWYLPGKVEGI